MTKKKIRIAVNLADTADLASALIHGASMTLSRRPGIEFLFIGSAPIINQLFLSDKNLASASEVLDVDLTSINANDPHFDSISEGRLAHIRLGLRALKDRRADAAMFFGPKNDLVEACLSSLPLLDHVEYPALASIWPTIRGENIILESSYLTGANYDELIIQALMGTAVAHVLFGLENPTVAILSGILSGYLSRAHSEYREIRKASTILYRNNRLPLQFLGLVGGDEIGAGNVDVLVAGGSSGQIALGVAEVTARRIRQELQAAIQKGFLARIGSFIGRRSIAAATNRLTALSPGTFALLGFGSVIVGRNCVSNAKMIAADMELCYILSCLNLIDEIKESIELYRSGC